jgi:hypothetical protein
MHAGSLEALHPSPTPAPPPLAPLTPLPPANVASTGRTVSPLITGVDFPAPRSQRKQAVVVVTIFLASAVFCVLMALNSASKSDDPVSPGQPKTEDPSVESLTPPPFAARPEAAPKASSSSRSILKPPRKHH